MTYQRCEKRMFLAINDMEIVFLVDAVYLHYGKTDIFYSFLLRIALEHLVKQQASILLRRHGVL